MSDRVGISPGGLRVDAATIYALERSGKARIRGVSCPICNCSQSNLVHRDPSAPADGWTWWRRASIFKRGIVGSFHKVSAKYLALYIAEFQL